MDSTLKALIVKSYLEAIIIFILIAMVLYAKWKVFEKTGEKGWKALIPFYSLYIEYEKFWGCGYLFLVPLFFAYLGMFNNIIGFVFTILSVVLEVLHLSKISGSFDKSSKFALGLIFLYPIFITLLAFDETAEYKGVIKDGLSYEEIVEQLRKK